MRLLGTHWRVLVTTAAVLVAATATVVAIGESRGRPTALAARVPFASTPAPSATPTPLPRARSSARPSHPPAGVPPQTSAASSIRPLLHPFVHPPHQSHPPVIPVGPLPPTIGSLSQFGGAFPANAVALTFDDGPDPTWTPAIMAVLAAHHARASFFDIGIHARAYPSIVRTEFERGYGVGNHTWTHPDLTTLPGPTVLAHIDHTDTELDQITGKRPTCLRPPYDAIDPAVRTLVATRALTMMLYDVDPEDWSRPGAAAIAARVLGAIHPGAIVDLHDGGGDRSQTLAALPLILSGLAARHLTTVAICR